MLDLAALADPLPIEPLPGPFTATIRPPGSKSLTCRAYLLAALADGDSRIVGPLRSDDTDRLLEALRTLGVKTRWEPDAVTISGVHGRFPAGGEVNLGDGGAPARFMIAAACLAAKPVVVDGSARMRERPVAEGVEFLRQLGARIDYLQDESRLPVRVTPAEGLAGGALEAPRTSSSQFLSALLLVGSALPQDIRLRHLGEVTSRSYLSLTCRVLRDWGVRITEDPAGTGQEVSPGPIPAREYAIEADASSAAYWLVAAHLTPGSVLTVPGLALESCQPDLRVVDVLQACGSSTRSEGRTLVLCAADAPREVPAIDAAEMPDAAMVLAVLAAMSPPPRDRPPCTITGLRTLRVKETDRLAALQAELSRIGCTVEATEDRLTVDPSSRHDRPALIETYRDHRMAMGFAVLGLVRPGIAVRDPGCVSKSYPGFWDDLRRLQEASDGAPAPPRD